MNSKSCMADAADLLLKKMNYMGSDCLTIAQRVGHDGSERGFHSQEIADALEHFDIFLRTRELYPCLQVPGGKIVPIFEKDKAVERFEKILQEADYGILVCRKPSGIHHAYAYYMEAAFDPSNREETDISSLDIVMLLEFV